MVNRTECGAVTSLYVNVCVSLNMLIRECVLARQSTAKVNAALRTIDARVHLMQFERALVMYNVSIFKYTRCGGI